MRSIPLALFFILFTITSALGQHFEGKITYSNTYTSKNSEVSDAQLTTLMGNQQEYWIKDGHYKSVANGKLFQWQIYLNKENRLYTKMANSEAALWNDAEIQGDKVLKVEVRRKAIEILGYLCDEVTLTCQSGIQKYYFNSKLGVNAKLFTNHKYGNWHDFIQVSNALPLKTIVENQQFTLVSIATQITPTALSLSFFSLPPGIPTQKALTKHLGDYASDFASATSCPIH